MRKITCDTCEANGVPDQNLSIFEQLIDDQICFVVWCPNCGSHTVKKLTEAQPIIDDTSKTPVKSGPLTVDAEVVPVIKGAQGIKIP